MTEIEALKAIIRDLTYLGDGGKWYTAYRADVEVNNQEMIQKIWDEEDCGCGLGDKCPDPPQEYDFAQEDSWEDRKNWWERR